MSKTFSIISLGCPRNEVDSESIISEFERKGYRFQENAEGVDTVIVNTCAFIEDAKRESIDTILKVIDAKKGGAVRKIVVAGCLSERYPDELASEFRDIDEFRGVLDFHCTFNGDKKARLTPKHYAYIKISEGCKNRCTYCIIPHLKGPYKSRDIGSIKKEAGKLVERGVKEIILVGQDTSLYGMDLYGRKKLARLLKDLDRISGENWIRLLYCHPANIDKDVIKIIQDSKHICKYIDLPVEHISDRVLRRMGRSIKTKDIISLIEYIRSSIPDVALRTSIIVGFPGETSEDFQELISFVKETRFERLGLFRYSREEGTPAYRLKGQISDKEKDRRYNEIMLLQQSIAQKINGRYKDRIMKVLIERKDNGFFIGRTQYDAPEVDGEVYVKGKGLKIGDFYNVRILDAYEYDLMGEVVCNKG